MKHAFFFLFLFVFISCVPNGIENDIISNETNKDSLKLAKENTDQFYINKAYEIGALDKDSTGDYPTAILYLDSALSRNPNNLEAIRLKSFSYTLMGDFNNALTTINRALQIDSTDPDSFMTRAGVLVSLDRSNEGLQDFYKVVQLDPNNGKALESIGYMEIENGNKAVGCDFLNRARNVGYLPQNREADKLLCD